MPRSKKPLPAGETPTPLQEIDRKIRYHEACIEKLKDRREKLIRPSRKQVTALLSRLEGMTMEEIAARLGVTL